MLDEKKKIVNMSLLLAMLEDSEEYFCNGSEPIDPIPYLIELISMHDIPMSNTVIQLGIACGVLADGYKNGWSVEKFLDKITEEEA